MRAALSRWPGLPGLASPQHWPVLAGTIGLLLAAGLLVVLVPGWQDQGAQADLSLRALARAAGAAAPAAPERTADQRLLQALPPARLGPQRIAALLALAPLHAVTLDSTRQGMAEAPAAGALAMARIPVTLNARGSYASLRQFVAAALQQDDALSLDQVRIGRSQPDATELAAQLQWSLLQQALPGKAADQPRRAVPR
jgi:hypothetical protein